MRLRVSTAVPASAAGSTLGDATSEAVATLPTLVYTVTHIFTNLD